MHSKFESLVGARAVHDLSMCSKTYFSIGSSAYLHKNYAEIGM